MGRSLDELAPVFRPLAEALLARLIEADVPVKIICTGRSQAEQDAAVARGASKVRVSKHQSGLALDVCPFLLWQAAGPDKLNWDAADPAFHTIGRLAESLGLRWGGRFGESAPGAGDGWDAGHVEYVAP